MRHDRGNTTSGGKHDDLFSLHVTSLDQSYFFIRHINYMRYNNIVCIYNFVMPFTGLLKGFALDVFCGLISLTLASIVFLSSLDYIKR